MEIYSHIDEMLKDKIREMYKKFDWGELKKISNTEEKNIAAFSEVYELDESKIIKVFDQNEYNEVIEDGYDVTYDYEPLLDLQTTDLVPILYAWELKSYVVMERIKTKTVYDLYKEGKWNGSYKELILNKIVEGFEVIIEKGWIPIDLKPFHIFVSEKNEIKFIDFTMYVPVGSYDNPLGIAISNLNMSLENYLK